MQLLGEDGAAYTGNLEEVQRLFRSGAASVTDYTTSDGYTALLWAVTGKQWHVVKWLLQEGGADVADRARKNGMTALHWAAFHRHVETVQFLLGECGADITNEDNRKIDVWGQLEGGLLCTFVQDLPTPAAMADVYSVLRCYGAPADPVAFIEQLPCMVDFDFMSNMPVVRPLPNAHRALLVKTEIAHANRNLLPYRAQRLACLHEGSDFSRILIPDIQNMVAEYLQPTAEDQLSAAVIAEAAEADHQFVAYLQLQLAGERELNAALERQHAALNKGHQHTVVEENAQSAVENQLSASDVAEAAEADEHARVHGRNVRRRVE